MTSLAIVSIGQKARTRRPACGANGAMTRRRRLRRRSGERLRSSRFPARPILLDAEQDFIQRELAKQGVAILCVVAMTARELVHEPQRVGDAEMFGEQPDGLVSHLTQRP